MKAVEKVQKKRLIRWMELDLGKMNVDVSVA